jgi:hypothetical protein
MHSRIGRWLGKCWAPAGRPLPSLSQSRLFVHNASAAREFKRQLDKAEFERARTAKLQKEIEETARQIARRTASCARIPTGLRDPLSRPSFRRRSS